ncbi:hypothetical protein C882_4118 [Caenispirillum salinarum AK4]|uniref:Membrane fusion protein (MFP) family protein n=1 Tax=Caenispirillum salinarum AK4 TaxID=1238182 RepID=K9HQS2_9PROT|nr:HlyD family type I secretion periplasmic adaptor subunit [Caenispirillum salinarum]EKV30781.1 hypothetical protein C882_4118 [Caenispirillum salinarum AK4]
MTDHPEMPEMHDPAASIRGPVIAGLVIVGLSFVGFGGWAATAPLAGAVAAPGVIAVEGGRKAVQHMEGGVVSAVLVAEGDRVAEGQVLARIDPVQASASVRRLTDRHNAARARVARLEAQREAAAAVAFPPDLTALAEADPVLSGVLEAERRAFAEAREALAGETEMTAGRLAQVREEIAALEATAVARAKEKRLLEEELAGIRDLHAKGLVTATRVRSLERGLAHLEGQEAQAEADRARAESSATEAELKLAQVHRAAREEAAAALRDARLEVADAAAQLQAAEDVLARTEVRAPRAGVVQGLAAQTVGGVVKPGQTLMEIVPDDQTLQIAARVPPTDIERVHVGQETEIRFPGLHDRNLPLLTGAVDVVPGDSQQDERTGMAFYNVTVSVPSGRVEGATDHVLKPGMPAEVMILTGERTLLDYLMKPLRSALDKALIEE